VLWDNVVTYILQLAKSSIKLGNRGLELFVREVGMGE